MSKQARPSFLKKTLPVGGSKKLLFYRSDAVQTPPSKIKKFFLLLFVNKKKPLLPSRDAHA
jgi:hypothetical protein